ncbi:MAG: hypothetical protein WKF84_21915, partial [Pyrinomonadaceae bacterium]
MTAPDGTVYKELFHHRRLEKGPHSPHRGARGRRAQKYTTTEWTQDNTALTYQNNPRPTDLSVYDEAGRRRRTSISYTPASRSNLPSVVEEYAADAATVVRRTETTYRQDAAYIDRRIIGLPNAKFVKEGNGTLRQKLDYHYDC